MPQLSIIVPVYNVEEYLDRCVKSVLVQGYSDFELILVDDGSPDRCPAMCDAWQRKDERIRVIHKENGGLSDARNAGLNIAKGEYIAFLDSDDYIHPQMYELMMAAMQQSQSDMVSCGFQQVSVGEEVEYPPYTLTGELVSVDSKTALAQFYDMYFDKIWVSACVKVYHRSIFDEIRFRKGIIFEDQDIFPYVVAKANRITIIPYALYYYTISPASITRSGFNEKYIDTIEMQGRHVVFFLQQGLSEQAGYAANLYIRSLVLTYRAIMEKEPGLKTLFWDSMKKHYPARRKMIFRNCSLGRIQRLIMVLFPVAPKLAIKIYGYINR